MQPDPWLLLLAAPVLEEIIFRLGLHETLLRRQWRPLHANLAVAAAFGMAHGLLRGGPWAWATALPALAIGAVYQWQRRVWPCVVIHAACNTIWWLWMPTIRTQ